MGFPLVGAATKILSSRGAFFVFGAITGPLLLKTLQPVGAASRTLLKSAIKGGLVAGHTVQGIVSEAKAGLGDIAAEAKADLSKPAAAATPTAEPTAS